MDVRAFACAHFGIWIGGTNSMSHDRSLAAPFSLHTLQGFFVQAALGGFPYHTNRSAILAPISQKPTGPDAGIVPRLATA